MRRRLAGALFLLLTLVASVAHGVEDSVRERVKAEIAGGDVAGAEAVLRELWTAEDPRLTDLLDGLDAAADFLPPREGLRHGASITARLVDDPPTDSQVWETVWGVAMRMREQVVDEVEVEGGERLLRALMRALPDDVRPLNDLARLHYDAGHPERARELYEELERRAPGRTAAVHRLARLAEDRGDLSAALRWYEYLIDLAYETGDPEIEAEALYAYQSKAQLLTEKLGRDDEARTTVEAWERALADVPPGAERDRSEAALARVRRTIDENEKRRVALREVRDSVRAKNLWIVGGWVLLVGGGVVLLRRLGLL